MIMKMDIFRKFLLDHEDFVSGLDSIDIILDPSLR